MTQNLIGMTQNTWHDINCHDTKSNWHNTKSNWHDTKSNWHDTKI